MPEIRKNYELYIPDENMETIIEKKEQNINDKINLVLKLVTELKGKIEFKSVGETEFFEGITSLKPFDPSIKQIRLIIDLK